MIAPGAISPFNRYLAGVGGGAAGWTLGRAVKFDGTNDYVAVNNLSTVAIETDFIGIATWIKLGPSFPYANGTIEGIFSTNTTGTSTDQYCFLSIHSFTTTFEIRWQVYDDGGTLRRFIRPAFLKADYAAGDIIHIVGLMQSDGIGGGWSSKIWVDNAKTEKTTADTITWLTNFGAQTLVGNNRLVAGRYFRGQVGDLVLFGGLDLSDANVTTLYNAGAGSDPSDIIPTSNMYFWHQYNEEPTTTACIDSSSEGTRTGTLTNFAGGGDANERPEFNP